ncbi:MAG: hypothetical protein ACJ8G3_03710 [Burkholderiaceae bacterium]
MTDLLQNSTGRRFRGHDVGSKSRQRFFETLVLKAQKFSACFLFLLCTDPNALKGIGFLWILAICLLTPNETAKAGMRLMPFS